MVRSEGNMSLKNPVTAPGIDPETVRLVAQSLNQYATPGPTNVKYISINKQLARFKHRFDIKYRLCQGHFLISNTSTDNITTFREQQGGPRSTGLRGTGVKYVFLTFKATFRVYGDNTFSYF